MTIRFDDAWRSAREIAQVATQHGFDVTISRDILGRISLLFDSNISDTALNNFGQQLAVATGNFVGPDPVQRTQDLFLPYNIHESPDLFVIQHRANGHGQLAILENRIVGSEWTRPPKQDPRSFRIALYGFKGAVGRSTAAFLLSSFLATQGKCVLLIDLDLESPGVSSLAQTEVDLPPYGLVDYLVEDAVHNVDNLELVSRSQRIRTDGNGEVWLAPAAGRPREDYDYLAKLNRVYTDLPSESANQSRKFGDRLEAAVSYCEQQVSEVSRTPDVVLLDSRAGIHDVAAVALTQLSNLKLMFATDNPQTWRGYSALFRQWNQLPNRRELGENIKMVSSMTPANAAETYLDSFKDHAQTCFAETLYEDAPADDVDAFNFAVDDPEAPHWPVPIMFHADLIGLDPSRQPDWHTKPFTQAAYGEFFQGITAAMDEERP